MSEEFTEEQARALTRAGFEIPVRPSLDPVELAVKAIVSLPPASLGLVARSLGNVKESAVSDES